MCARATPRVLFRQCEGGLLTAAMAAGRGAVNLASRLVDVAPPDTVLADDRFAEAIADNSALAIEPYAHQRPKGLGRVHTFTPAPRPHQLSGPTTGPSRAAFSLRARHEFRSRVNAVAAGNETARYRLRPKAEASLRPRNVGRRVTQVLRPVSKGPTLQLPPLELRV
jgi:hypothetical protein